MNLKRNAYEGKGSILIGVMIGASVRGEDEYWTIRKEQRGTYVNIGIVVMKTDTSIRDSGKAVNL